MSCNPQNPPSHALVDAIRAHLSSQRALHPQPAHRRSLANHVLRLIARMPESDPAHSHTYSEMDRHTQDLHRKIAETSLVCLTMLPATHEQIVSQSLKLPEIAPHHPGSHLQCARTFLSLGHPRIATVHAWKSLLIAEHTHQPDLFQKGIALLAKCHTLLNTVRLDVVEEAVANDVRAHPRNHMLGDQLWPSLSTKQKRMHANHLPTIEALFFQNGLPMRSPTVHHRNPASLIFRTTSDGRDTLQKLPQYFSYIVPFTFAASAAPRQQADISNLAALGFSKVVTLCMEKPLNQQWFTHHIRNVFLPVKDMYPPSHAQLDAFFAEATEKDARTLVHCVAGKGRTGTFLAAWAMLYGFGQPPILCGSCSARLHGGLRHRLRIGSCALDRCSLGCRQPAMSAEEAIELVRSLRSSSVSAGRQEAFLKEYSSELWRRATGSVLEGQNPGNLLDIASEEDCSAPLQVFGNCPKHLPSLIVLCGLPGSGKSSFARSISQKAGNRCVIACQDEMGTKAACEVAISNAMKNKEKSCSIVDRCNVLEQNRIEWLDIAFNPRDAVLVYLETPIETCIARAQGRVDHKTVVPGKAERLIRSLSRSLQPPGERDVSRGFDAVMIAKGQYALSELLGLIGITEGPEALQQPTGTCDASREPQANRKINLIKFPRTRHLVDLGSTTRDDLHIDPAEAQKILDLHGCNGMTVHLEEKLDGSNIGLSLDRDTGVIRVQNRSHFVCASSHPQYRLLPRFIERYEEDLRKVLDNDPNNILYGEWLYARHSVSYMQLPSYFVAFDLYDGRREKFFSRERFADVLKGTELKAVPEIHIAGNKYFTLDSIVDRSLNGRSSFGDVALEGIYVRVDQGDWLVERAKVVRPGFIAGNAHWSRQIVEQNRVVEGGEIFSYI